MLQAPNFYTGHDGGRFIPWTFGNLPTQWLKERNPQYVNMLVNHKWVGIHSMLWFTKSGKLISRWDCINGWTK